MTKQLPHRLVLVGGLSLPAPWPARHASAWGGKPARLIVPYPPGGITNLVARRVADALGQRQGRPVVVDNRPGASGNLAAEIVARAAPDGDTLYVGFAGARAMNVSLYPPVEL